MSFKKSLHILTKSICFFAFGLGSLIFSLFVGPLVLFFIKPVEKADRIVRTMVCSSFRMFGLFMRLLHTISFQLRGAEKLRQTESMIICANHPTLLDAVFLIGIVPGADCIVKSSHWKNPITRGIVSHLYIPNSLNAQETIDACEKSLDMGNNIILFPEGTRTKFGVEPVKFYRSAAQLALRTKHNVLPIFIDVNRPTGLGKGDSFFSCPESGIINFDISIREPILVADYKDLPLSIAARRLTDHIKTAIFP